MATTYNLVIEQGDLNAKAISVIRKRFGIAIGEIRRRVIAGEPVYECGVTDNNGIALIVMAHRDLDASGVGDHVLRGAREVGVVYLENVLRERREDVVADGEEDLFEDEIWWNLDLGKA